MIDVVAGPRTTGVRSPDADRLVGRDAELTALRALLNFDDPARPVTALVGGDAGVGKTRLLSELTEAAGAMGARVLIGHCLHFGGDAVPYLPITEAFGRLAREERGVLEHLRMTVPPVDRLLPQRRMIGADSAAAAPLDAADLFEAVLGALLELAGSRPVLLVVEDVHWADASTRDLIGFLLSRVAGGPISVVVSYRTDDLHRRHPLRPVVAEWSRMTDVIRLTLGPLDDVAMRQLLDQHRAGPLDDDVVAGILNRAGGNAFFAEQLVAEIGGSAQLPTELADLLLIRLERLSMPARQVVRLVAVSGRTISHQLLLAVAGSDDDPAAVQAELGSGAELDAALREAVEAHVLDRRGPDAFTFRHALLAEAVYDDLLPGERVGLHRRFARAMVQGRFRGTDADLARHAREAMDFDTAFAASVRAGDEASRMAAPAEAMRHYEAALELAARRIDHDGPGTAPPPSLIIAAADAAALAGHQHRALHLVKDTLAALGPGAPPEVRAELLVASARYALALDLPAEFVPATAEAMRLVPAAPPSALRARVLAVHAQRSADVERTEDATRAASEALTMARTLGLADVVADAATTLARIDERLADPEAASRTLRASIVEARGAGELGSELRGLVSLGGLQYDRGEVAAAIEMYKTAMDRAAAGGRPWSIYGLDSRVLASQALYVAGDWDRSLELARPAGPSTPPWARAVLGAVGLGVRAGRGETGALADLTDLRPWWSRDGMVAILTVAPLMDLLGGARQWPAALDLHDAAVAEVVDLWQNQWFQARIRLHALALGVLADAAAESTATERAEQIARGTELMTGIRATAEKGVTRQATRGPEGRAWLARGAAEWARLRWRAGRDAPAAGELVEIWQRTADAFGYAQVVDRNVGPARGHVFERARSQARLAAVQQAAGVPGAQANADAARAVARRLGAVPLLDELRALGGRGIRSAPGPGQPLTPREHQVLVRLSAGDTNRQIARTLFISEKTVSVHVSNILAKVGAAGRTEAAAIARRTGLLGAVVDPGVRDRDA